MGTRTSRTNTKAVKLSKCSICYKVPTPDCAWHQGRCPHHPSMLDTILSDPYKSRFYNLIKFFKGSK
jgi:hypothetical protein